MKRLIILILFCASIVNADDRLMLARSNPYVLGSVPVTAIDVSDIIFWWRCESTSLDANDDYSVGDTSATTASGALINADAKKTGTNGCDFPSEGDNFNFTIAAGSGNKGDIIVSTAGRFGFWFYLNTTDVSRVVFKVVWSAAGDDVKLYTAGDPIDELSMDFGSRAVSTTNANLSGWNFIEVAWDTVTPYLKIYVNGTEKGSQSLSLTAFDNSTGGTLYVGNTNSSGTVDFMIDQVVISNSPTRDFYDLIVTKGYVAYP